MIRRLIGPALTVLAGVAFVALMGFLLHQQPSPALAAAAKPGAGDARHVYLHLSTYPDSMAGEHGTDGGAEPDWVSYGPTTTLTVPAQLAGHRDDQPVRRRRGDHQPVVRAGARHGRGHRDGRRQAGDEAGPGGRSATRSPSTPRRPPRTRCSSARRCPPCRTTRRPRPAAPTPSRRGHVLVPDEGARASTSGTASSRAATAPTPSSAAPCPRAATCPGR